MLEPVAPDQVGAASGPMSTAHQIGYALGVAVTGVIFFGSAPRGTAHAFELSLPADVGRMPSVVGFLEPA